MASAAAPSPLPVASLSARRGATAPRAVTAAGPYPYPLGFPRRLKPSTGGAPRSSLRVVASSSKVDPVEERTPVAPLTDVPVPADASPPGPSLQPQPQVSTGKWKWRGYNIRYQQAGTSGPALVLIHGFGANSDHWRKNIPVLAMANRVYAMDLVGYGYSDKPNPREIEENFYTFETWGEQLNTFCNEVVKSQAFFICNSIGGLVALQAAVMEPQTCKGIVLLDISLRMLHIKKQPWFGKPFIKSFQSLLRNTIVGKLFFNAVATPESVKNILCQCYHDTSAVTDELVQIILQPGLDPGAVDVFLEFISYSGGPLPEELLPLVKCPVLVAWGEKDPWEPVELGRAYASFDTVEDFVVLPDVGHCPQDEAPELVNPLVESFVQRHISDGGFAKGSIDLGGLEVRQVTTFDKVWSTTQGGPEGVGATFFKPSPVPAGFSVLGHYAQPNNRPLFGHVLVGRDTSGTGALLAAPVDYTLVWSSPDGAGHFWLPAPPDGYKAVGAVVTATPNKPSPDEVRCVRADFTDASETEESVLSSDKDGFSAATLRPAVRGIDARGVRAGTFVAQSSAAPPSTPACLKNNNANYTSSMPDLAQVNSLVAAYAPHLYLHPNEPYLPSSVTWFFENGALLYQKGSQAAPTPVAADGSNLSQGGGNDGGYWLDLPVDKNQREKVKKGDLGSAKVYAQAKPMLGGTVTDLAVWIFYPFNGPARAKVGLLTIPLGEIGEHTGNWEHVTLRVSNFSGELLRMYFSQHSAGAWVEASQLEYLDCGDGVNRPVAYASLHGHALYPKAGLVLQGDERLGVGIRNDAARGSRLDAGAAGRCEVVSAEYLGVAEPAWLTYEREWGPREEYDIGREINRVARILPRKVRERLAKLVEKVLVGEGPTGPKMHGNWRNDEREA